MWTIDPLIPLSLWWALCLAVLLAVGWYALRRDLPLSRGRHVLISGLLLLGAAGPLCIALNPTWVETLPPLPGNPLLTVLVDGTMSMRTEDIEDGSGQRRSRWTNARRLAEQVESRGSVEVRRQVFDDKLQPLPDENLDEELDGASRARSADAANRASLSGGRTASASQAGDSAGEANSVPQSDWPRGHRTDLASVLRATARTGSPVGHAVLLVSDAAHNVGSTDNLLQAAREANALATPIYTVTLGTSVGMKNMSLTAKSSRLIAFPDNPLSIRATLSHSGLAGQTTRVSLFRDDQLLDQQSVRLNAQSSQEVRFELERGVDQPIQRYRIAATEVTGEATTADNQTTVLVQRLNAPIGVLVLEGKPYWDSKFLGRNLASDPVVDLTTIVRLSSNRFLQRKVDRDSLGAKLIATQSPSAESNGADPPPDGSPTGASTGSSTKAAGDAQAADSDWSIVTDLDSPLESRDLLEDYRVVMLGRDADVYLTSTAIENLREWVSQTGGCLLCARGAPSSQIAAKLSEILPVRWVHGNESHFRTQLSGHGRDSAVFDPLLSSAGDPLASLPSLATADRPRLRAGLPQILIESNTAEGDSTIPVVTYQPYGRGQTVVVEGAGMWRWAFLPPQHAAKDAIYPSLWQAMIQWIVSQQDIMPGQDVAIRPDRASFLSGDPATASVIVRDPQRWNGGGGQLDLAVMLQAASQDVPRRLPLIPSGMQEGLYRVELGKLSVGYYALRLVTGQRDETLATTAFEVRDPWFESLEVDARPDLARQIARLSGGRQLQPEEVPKLVEEFEQLLKQNQQVEEIRTSMWDRPSILLIILCGWIVTWIIRRRSGLV